MSFPLSGSWTEPSSSQSLGWGSNVTNPSSGSQPSSQSLGWGSNVANPSTSSQPSSSLPNSNSWSNTRIPRRLPPPPRTDVNGRIGEQRTVNAMRLEEVESGLRAMQQRTDRMKKDVGVLLASFDKLEKQFVALRDEERRGHKLVVEEFRREYARHREKNASAVQQMRQAEYRSAVVDVGQEIKRGLLGELEPIVQQKVQEQMGAVGKEASRAVLEHLPNAFARIEQDIADRVLRLVRKDVEDRLPGQIRDILRDLAPCGQPKPVKQESVFEEDSGICEDAHRSAPTRMKHIPGNGSPSTGEDVETKSTGSDSLFQEVPVRVASGQTTPVPISYNDSLIRTSDDSNVGIVEHADDESVADSLFGPPSVADGDVRVKGEVKEEPIVPELDFMSFDSDIQLIEVPTSPPRAVDERVRNSDRSLGDAAPNTRQRSRLRRRFRNL